MSANTDSPEPGASRSEDFSHWLAHLQRQSWELELLITGFSIFLLLKTPQALNSLEAIVTRDLGVGASGLAAYCVGVLKVTVGVLIFNLVVHVVLRGVWIGYVGLSSVFPEGIRFHRLGYRPRFIDAMQQRAVDQTRAIVSIDQVSSAIFSFSFLIAGYVLSAALSFFILLVIISLTTVFEEASAIVRHSVTMMVVLWVLLMFLGLIDFITAGGLKRIKWLERPWGVLHRFLSIVTLSFVYRPIYYVLATNYRRWVVHSTVLLYLGVVGWLSLADGGQGFRNLAMAETTVRADSYDSLRQGEKTIAMASLLSERLTGNYLRVFVRHDFKDMQVFDAVCGPLEKQKALRLFGIRLTFKAGDAKEIDRSEQSTRALSCLRRLYRFRIGDQIHQQEMLFHRHPNRGEEGLLTWIPVAEVAGLSRLIIEKRTGAGEGDWRVFAEISFFRDPPPKSQD